MVASRIEARAVFKVMAIVVVAIGIAVLLNHVIVEVKTTIRWVCAAVFLALALAPLVDLVRRVHVRGRHAPRWLAILISYVLFLVAFILLVLTVIPPIVREVEQLASQLPTYVKDFEQLGDQQRAVPGAQRQVRHHPAALQRGLAAAGEARRRRRSRQGGDGRDPQQHRRGGRRADADVLPADRRRATVPQAHRAPGASRSAIACAGSASGSPAIVRSYVSVNLLLAALAGVFTWLALELLGVELAVPLAVLVALFDLVPLIGFTIGGLFVAIVAALHGFPGTFLIWIALFIVYQQVQDRVIQPIFYKNAVKIHPAVAVIAVLAGAQLAGILGALLAIPVAASLGVIFDEIWPPPADQDEDSAALPEPSSPASGAASAPG